MEKQSARERFDAWMRDIVGRMADKGNIPAGAMPPVHPPVKPPTRPHKRPRQQTGPKPGTRSKTPPAARQAAPAAPAPEPPPARPFDVTRDDGEIWITSPRAGGERKGFVIKRQPDDSVFAPGRRIVGRIDNNGWVKTFGFVDEFGIRLFKSYRGDHPGAAVDKGGRTKWEWYAEMLTDSARFVEKGYVYEYIRK